MEAYLSPADVLFYGGAAGGGKTDLAIGLALTAHQRSMIFRREATQLSGIYDRMAEVLGNRDGFNGQQRVWRIADRMVQFGSCPHAGDETAHQGIPHDLKVFDEVPLFTEPQFRFLNAWKRTTRRGQRVRVVCTGNPPTNSDGEWVVRYWAPWLDPNHPNPAAPGELRWFAVNPEGKDVELPDSKPFVWRGDERVYDLDGVEPNDIEYPHSRTFIPSRVTDNPFLMETGYRATLQALPEPLRSQMLNGDFMAGRGDDPWQVIPTEWVRQAQARWTARSPKGTMHALGCDVARGGRDETILAPRHGAWYDALLVYPGGTTPDGPAVAGLVLAAQRNGAPVNIDVVGVGASAYDHLKGANVDVEGVNGAEGSNETDESGRLQFKNKRAELYWKFRESLDPKNDRGVALPPDDQLRADLTAPRWSLSSGKILVEKKEDIAKRIGRSTDRGDAVIYASIDRPFGKRERLPIRRKFVV
jgi:hypothetical protein